MLYGIPLLSSSCYETELKERLKKANRPVADLLMEENVILVSSPEFFISCRLTGLKSQCGIIFIDNWEYSYNGLSKLTDILEKAEKVAKELNYSRAYITHTSESFKQELLKNGYREIDEFGNKRSGNKVYVLSKNIA